MKLRRSNARLADYQGAARREDRFWYGWAHALLSRWFIIGWTTERVRGSLWWEPWMNGYATIICRRVPV